MNTLNKFCCRRVAVGRLDCYCTCRSVCESPIMEVDKDKVKRAIDLLTSIGSQERNHVVSDEEERG